MLIKLRATQLQLLIFVALFHEKNIISKSMGLRDYTANAFLSLELKRKNY